MPVIKAPPRQIRSATIQVRVEEEISTKLKRYAEFIDCAPAYVVSEALKLLFNKDSEFRQWLQQNCKEKTDVLSAAGSKVETGQSKRAYTVQPLLAPEGGPITK